MGKKEEVRMTEGKTIFMFIIALICVVAITAGVTFGALKWYSHFISTKEYEITDTRDVEYLGKYETSELVLTGRAHRTRYRYYLVFKQFDDLANSTTICIEVSDKTYRITTIIEEPISMQFSKDSKNNLYIKWGDGYKSVHDYDPSKSLGSETLVDAIFIDALYSPAPL